MHVKVNDTVAVIAGEDRDARGKVLSIDRGRGKLIVEGVNRVKKHVRRSQRNPQGGQLDKEMPIQISNVLLVCTKCGEATRAGVRYLEDGGKERYCKRKNCRASLGAIAPPRAEGVRQFKMQMQFRPEILTPET